MRISGENVVKNTDIKRAMLHYAWSVLVLGVYGGQVCPYIEGLGVNHWINVLGGFFGVFFVFRLWLLDQVMPGVPYERQTGRQLFLELGLFLAVSLSIAIYNMMAYEFPIDSGLKIVVGTLMLGFFASVDLALERARAIAGQLASTGRDIVPGEKYLSLATKFLLLALTSVVLVTVVIFLVISKDLQWLAMLGRRDYSEARLAVLGELVFIAGVVFVGLFNLMVSYSRNLRIFFDNENSSLKAVAGGDFSRPVVVSTNDEFGEMGVYTNRMIGDLESKVAEIQRTQDATIHSLATIAEIRDMETGLHIVRTKLYVKVLAEWLSRLPEFSDALDSKTVELMWKSAPLHDIGKVGIPDAVLLKPDKLTREEFEVMKRHPVLGGDALGEAEKVLGESSFLCLAREIAYSHHEKWDGTGYPKGLKGEAIPISGRLMALADVYDALVFKRVYKPALTHEQTRAIIMKERGRHFDPLVLDAFVELESEFKAIARDYGEKEAGALKGAAEVVH